MYGESPKLLGVLLVILNTSALLLRYAPWGTCHPHLDTSPSAGIPSWQYLLKYWVRSTQELQTARVVNSGQVQFPVGQLNLRLADGSDSENNP